MGLHLKKWLLPPGWLHRILFCLCFALYGCGGGGGSSGAPAGSKPAVQLVSSVALSTASSFSSTSVSSSSTSLFIMSSASSPALASSFSSSSSAGQLVSLSGTVTYDSVPYNDNQLGLNYAATIKAPGRGLVVELVGSDNAMLASTLSDALGNYRFSIEQHKPVKVRVKAQLLRAQSPAWNFKVTDNTSANSLYAMEGRLLAADETTAVRDLHAASGWTGAGYTEPRVAAPFAILDSVLVGVERVNAAGNRNNFPELELRWSSANKTAEGELTLGEIGTSFYSGSAIYILGDENNDTDEYDRHVILHEWAHYLESAFARSDNIGGAHVYGDKLDMRVAMSEGFANAFSAMMLDDPDYRDSSGVRQTRGFINNVSRKNHAVRGWYSEASVESVLYNFYTSDSGKVARDFTDIFSVFSSTGYAATTALTSIYVFADELRNVIPAQSSNFNTLLLEQNIETTNAFGVGESNSGGYVGTLPIYKPLLADNSPVTVCSSNRFGSYNKLAVAQFVLIDITLPGAYQINARKTGSDAVASDPDLYLYRGGSMVAFAEGVDVDQENLSRVLPAGVYVLEVVDDRARDVANTNEITACFAVRLQQTN